MNSLNPLQSPVVTISGTPGSDHIRLTRLKGETLYYEVRRHTSNGSFEKNDKGQEEVERRKVDLPDGAVLEVDLGRGAQGYGDTFEVAKDADLSRYRLLVLGSKDKTVLRAEKGAAFRSATLLIEPSVTKVEGSFRGEENNPLRTLAGEGKSRILEIIGQKEGALRYRFLDTQADSGAAPAEKSIALADGEPLLVDLRTGCGAFRIAPGADLTRIPMIVAGSPQEDRVQVGRGAALGALHLHLGEGENVVEVEEFARAAELVGHSGSQSSRFVFWNRLADARTLKALPEQGERWRWLEGSGAGAPAEGDVSQAGFKTGVLDLTFDGGENAVLLGSYLEAQRSILLRGGDGDDQFCILDHVYVGEGGDFHLWGWGGDDAYLLFGARHPNRLPIAITNCTSNDTVTFPHGLQEKAETNKETTTGLRMAFYAAGSKTPYFSLSNMKFIRFADLDFLGRRYDRNTTKDQNCECKDNIEDLRRK